MNYRDVEIEAFGLEKSKGPNKERFWTFKVRLSDSPAGSMSADEAVTVQFDYRPFSRKLDKLDNRSLKGADLVTLGRALADLLLPEEKFTESSSVRSLFTDNRKAAVSTADEGVRLRLKLGYELAKLPWEFIYLPPPGGSGGVDGFLALDGRLSIVRHESLDSAKHKPAPKGKIKMIAAFASPDGAPELDLTQEQANLEDALAETAHLSAEILADAEFSEFEEALLPKDIGIFHFGGHGDIQEQMGASPGEVIATATLGFDDKWVKADQLALNLRDSGVRLAVLGACNSGRREGKNPWAGIASMLVKTGVPAVVANQFKILDKTAIAFSKLFYKALVAGMSIEEAVSAGRKAAYNADPEGRDWGIQALYLRSEHSQILFKGTKSKARQAEYKQEVERHIININSGGGTVITGNINVSGDFVGGNKTTTTVNIGSHNSGNIVTGSSNIIGSGNVVASGNRLAESPASRALTPQNQAIINVLAQLQVELMRSAPAGNKTALGARLSDLERELQKGDGAKDIDVAALVKDLGELAPAGANLIKSAFETPALAKMGVGLFTQFALNEL